MPFTPFHFGPGLLVKAAFPKRISFTAFAATQILIDVETLYYLVRNDWPVHRQLHSLVGGVLMGLVVGAAVVVARPLLNRAAPAIFPSRSDPLSWLGAETNGAAAALGGVLGGASHSLFDGIMHSDVRALWPFSDGQGPYRLLGYESLHVFCVAAAILGVAWLWLRTR